MKRTNFIAVTALLALALVPAAVASDSPFQVSYAANLVLGDSVINITNTGANGDNLFGPGAGTTGNICVNVYVLSPDEQLIACCSCLASPNALLSLSVQQDLLINTLTPVHPESVVIKLLSTVPGTGGIDTSCTNSAATQGGTRVLATGMAAWGTTIRRGASGGIAVSEAPFTSVTVSSDELESLTNRCAFIIGNASPIGICRSCRNGGLGSSRIN